GRRAALAAFPPRRSSDLSCCGQTIHTGPSNQYGLRTQSKCLENICASSNATVHQKRNLALDHIAYLLERIQGCHCTVYLSSAMIGDDDAIDIVFKGHLCIVRMQNTFQNDG